MIGKVLGNRYEILEQLGGGGMAIVYKGRDTFLNRLVTVKVLRPEFVSDQNFIRRFQYEAQAAAGLSHPNIVSIYDVGQEEDVHYLVMEYIDGDNLKTVIKREGALPVEKAIRIALQICEALEHAHEHNIIHRDVKPHNILITREGWVKLTDFGIAREVTATTFTQTDTIMGSVHYLSPEQARGQLAGPKSDLYSLGVVLYEMLSGCVPFHGDSPIAVAIKHIQEEPLPPSCLNKAIPPRLEEVVLQALKKNPDERFASAREMFNSLQKTVASREEEFTRFIPADVTRVLKPVRPLEEEEVDITHQKKLPFWRWLVTSLVLLLLLAGGAFAFDHYFGYYFNNQVTVPDVTRKSLEEATEILTKLGLEVKTRKEHHPLIPKGQVIDQDIGPDHPPVKLPRKVTLTVSLGPDLVEVPNLYRLAPSEANMRLVEAGLRLAEPVEGYSDSVPAGYIFAQEPGAKSKQIRGSLVKVYVSKGPQPIEYQVPSLIGLTLNEARSRLNEVGLQLDERNIQWAESTDYLPGRIIRQEPAENSKVLEGSAIKVILSKGPGPSPREADVKVPVPDDGRNHQVKINVQDAEGLKNVYINNHSPGEVVVIRVRFYGPATIRTYIDNNLIDEQSI